MTPNRFEVDCDAIARNVVEIRKSVGAGVWLCAALKADAYGFGLVPVAKTVLAAGADAVAVGSVGDGIALRKVGVSASILVYGGEPLSSLVVEDLEAHELIATIHDQVSLRACLRSARRSLSVMVEVDVGLMRLGFEPADVPDAVSSVQASPALQLRGLYTHMRVDNRREAAAMRKQFGRFEAVLKSIDPVPLAMAASSRVLDRSGSMTLNAVDVGRAVYGLLPSTGGRLGPRLRPAFAALRTNLVTVKAVGPESRTGALAGVRRLGVIPFGRAAGMAELSVGRVLVRGRRAPVVGSPSLEHTRVDLSRHPDARAGDEVIVVGRQGAALIRPGEVLRAHPETPDSALGLMVRGSVPRVYLRGSRARGGARTAERRKRLSRRDPRSRGGDAC